MKSKGDIGYMSANKKITFIAPSLKNENYSNAYILGNIAWLLMHSTQHQTMPLHLLNSQVFPAINNQQYVLGLDENGSPIFYVAWANFDAENEEAYLQNYNLSLTPAGWNSGDRTWILFIVAPFGDLSAGYDWMKKNLFVGIPEVRFLYHQGKKRGTRILCKRGKGVSASEAYAWHKKHLLPQAVKIQLEKDVYLLKNSWNITQ